MAKPLRIEFDRALYHINVTSSGNAREPPSLPTRERCHRQCFRLSNT
ncbi:hypothetical protein KsCSTR_02110 [Candidatus Kuenenia stuttgartiensis]|uniref:Uncharacterized protein n=1 Tax=Kuenenia stuttgartiensis TaxID=174633 RepID=A0A6G7GIZ1_KUEST|nr:hypothetical protein KsCSTR_02110 [Candidatus Kuenenia stuttgartiensis]